MLKRHNCHNEGLTIHRLSLELGGVRGATHLQHLADHHDEGEMLFAALERLDDLIQGCDELLDLVSPDWTLPSLPGGVRLKRTLERGEYGVAVMLGAGVLGRSTGSRKNEHNVAHAALSAARGRLESWHAEVETQYRQEAVA